MAERSLSTGALARAAGVGLETVRYYERTGLLPEPPRTPHGHRRYPPEAIRRLRFIRSAQELGFTLREIAELLELRVAPNRSCESVAATADRVIERVDERMRELARVRRALAALREACDSEEAQGACPILEFLEVDKGGDRK